jgi:hypothetical protein
VNEQNLIQTTADQLIAFARERGVDLAAHFSGGLFWSIASDRYIGLKWHGNVLEFWLSGASQLPAALPNTSDTTDDNRVYSENGIVNDIHRAYRLVMDWLFARRNVDDLPARFSSKLGWVEK